VGFGLEQHGRTGDRGFGRWLRADPACDRHETDPVLRTTGGYRHHPTAPVPAIRKR